MILDAIPTQDGLGHQHLSRSRRSFAPTQSAEEPPNRVNPNAVSGSITVHSLEVVVEADLAASSMWAPGRAPGPVGFEAIRVAVHMRADAPPEALRALVAHALLWSPVANTLHDLVHLDVALGAAVAAGV